MEMFWVKKPFELLALAVRARVPRASKVPDLPNRRQKNQEFSGKKNRKRYGRPRFWPPVFGKREHIGARLQVPAKRMIRSRKGHMRVDLPVDHIPIHRNQIGRRGGILHEPVLRRQRPVADLMDMVAPQLTRGGKDHRIANLLLANHLLEPGEQVGVELKAKNHHPGELTAQRASARYLRIVGLLLVRRIRRRIDDFPPLRLGAQESAAKEKNDKE